MAKRVVALACVLILLAALQSAVQSQSPADMIPALAARINLWRLRVGLSPLVYNPTLEAMAASQADYLLTLPELPAGGDIHFGAKGDDVRQRSQFEAFHWPTYGHPERISVAEIAAVGSIDTALDYWQHSEIHTRSATNPAYREMGIAARQHGDDDVLFIVVLGGRPGVLTALADPEAGELYLTSELNEWQGDWIGAVTRYRFLDSAHQPVGGWHDWQIRVLLPGDIKGDLFYVEYEDAGQHRTEAEVRLPPVWSSSTYNPGTKAPQSSVGMVFATNTPVPLPTSTPTVTPTPLPDGVRLVYYPGVFTLMALTDGVNVGRLSFQNGDVIFSARRWEAPNSDLNIGALPQNHCLQIWLQDSGDYAAPPECSYVRSVLFRPENQLFWREGSFSVLVDEQAVATCAADAGQCDVFLP